MDRKLKLRKEMDSLSTPEMKRVGYGTGVGIFHMTPNGKCNSPWVLKKLMRRSHAKKPSRIVGKRLRNEAKILRKLNHPNIVGYRGFWITRDGRECLALEECPLCLGDLLEEKRDQNRNDIFPIGIISKMTFDIARALDYLHNNVGLLHGDIKSHNILIKGNYVFKLCDFGVSLPLKADGTLDKVKAGKEYSYVGTRLWCALEVSRKAKTQIITDKADMFAYGLTIWEMLTNETPYLDGQDPSMVGDAEYDKEFEDIIEDRIGKRPALPEWMRCDSTFYDIMDVFAVCTREDYRKRFSAAKVLKLCEKNFKWDLTGPWRPIS